MKILIAGDGETGTHLAEMLSVEGQDVTLLGSNRDRLQELDSTSNFMTAIGCATAVDSLQECGVAGVDLFVAVTPDENVNLVACELAKGCGARCCVARVDNPQYGQTDVAAMLKDNGVDQTIYPERMVAETALHFIRHNWATDWFRLHNGKLLVVGVRVAGDDAFAGRTLRELASSPKFFHVAVIKRGGNAIIPRGDDRVLPGDTLYISVSYTHLTLPTN